MTDLDTLVEIGGSIKVLAEEPERIKIGGYAVLFGSPETGDLSEHRDYFTKATDYALDVSPRGRVRWHHGLDPVIGRVSLGTVEFKAEPDDIGVWAEGWIKRVEDYEKKVAEWVKQGKTGFSTGTAAHCVGRKAVGDAHEITEWPLGSDVSITLTPADPRQVGGVLALKSLMGEPESPESATFAETLKRAESAIAWAISCPQLNGTKAAAVKSLMESMKAYRDSRIDPAKVEADRKRITDLLTRIKG